MKNYVIIGNSAAGISAAKEIRRQDPKGKITVISDEPVYGYSRVLLPLYIAGKISRRGMILTNRAFYISEKIRLLRDESVKEIDPKGQRVYTEKGLNLPYDRLLIATGSSAKRLEISGKDLPGIHTLRKVSDAEAIRGDLASSKGSALVVGGGLVGVKSLDALAARKRKIDWVISSNRVLSQMIDTAGSDLLLRSFQRKGVALHLQTDVEAFEGKGRLQRVLLSNGKALQCDLAIVGKGVNPNIDSLAGTGIALNQGIVVDRHMATNLPSVYAAGDVAEPFDLLLGRNSLNPLWPFAVEGGRVAGSNMAGIPAVFSGALRMNSMEVSGMRVVSAGEWKGNVEARAFRKGETTIYRKLVFSGGRLKGFVLIGEVRGAGILTSLIKNQTEVAPSMLEEGLRRGFSYQPRFYSLGGRVETIES